jgi:hypothetical protein
VRTVSVLRMPKPSWVITPCGCWSETSSG